MLTTQLIIGVTSYLLIVVAAQDFCDALNGIMDSTRSACCPKSCGKCGGQHCQDRGKNCCTSGNRWDVCERGRKAPCRLAGAEIDDGMRTDYAFLMDKAYDKEYKVGDRQKHGVTGSEWRITGRLQSDEGLMWLLKGINRHECVVNTMGSDNLCLSGNCSDLDNNFNQKSTQVDNTGYYVAQGYHDHARDILRTHRPSTPFDARGWRKDSDLCATNERLKTSIGSYTLPSVSLTECSRVCFWTLDCLAFSYQSQGGVCRLVSFVPLAMERRQEREEFLLRNPGVCYEREDSGPAGCSMVEESDRAKVYCDWDSADKDGRRSLGGSGHSEASCKTACLGDPECMFASINNDGLCHMFKTCSNPRARSQFKMFKKSCLRPNAEFRSEFWDHDNAYCRIGHDSSKCLEDRSQDNGEGWKLDIDCTDCSSPPRQKCADGYIKSAARDGNGCTRITCTKPGTEVEDMDNREECSEACLHKSWCSGFGFVNGMCHLFKERPTEGVVTSGQCYAKQSGCEMHQSTKSGNYCDWDGVDKPDRASLGGAGHTLEACKRACIERGDLCKFASFSESGGCHMFKTCNNPVSRGFQQFEKKCLKPWNTHIPRTNQHVLSEFLNQCKNEKRDIGLTGHSLGGSVSTWLAIALDKGAYGLPKIPVTRVITYGQPRVVTKKTSGRCPSRLRDRKVAERIVNVEFLSGELDPAPRGFAHGFDPNAKFCFESRSLDEHNRYQSESTSYPLNRISFGNIIIPGGGFTNWANFAWHLHERKEYHARTVNHYRGKIGGWDDGIPCVPKEVAFGVETPLLSCSQCKNGYDFWGYSMACGKTFTAIFG